jgi:hypothetical protein
MSGAEVAAVSSEFDIFVRRPIQTAVLGTVETIYKPLAPVEQNDLEFVIPCDSDTYIDLDIKIYVRGKLVSSSGMDADLKDTTAVTNNLLHSLFSQCTVMLKEDLVTQSDDNYNYRAYLETLLTYSSDTASSHLTKCYWYLDTGEMNPCDPMAETYTASTNDGIVARWSRLSGSRDVQLLRRLRTDFCNVPIFMLPDVKLQIKLTKTRPSFHLINKTSDLNTSF